MLLSLAVAGLPPRRREWGDAMQVELDLLDAAARRWRFSLGCVWAVAVIRIRASLGSREAGGKALRMVVLSGVAIAVGLVVYGLARYPGIRTGAVAWASSLAFVGIVFMYAAATLALSRGSSHGQVLARRYGLAGGIVVGGSWLAALSPPALFKGWVAFPLVVALLGPACIVALTARRCRDATAGARAGLWSGIVGGLAVFVVWVTTTYVRSGRPYDAGMRRDFRASHAHDLATYAVGDNLGSALVLLLLVPTLALAAGSLIARAAAR